MNEPLEVLLENEDRRSKPGEAPRARPQPLPTWSGDDVPDLARERQQHEHRPDRQQQRQIGEICVPGGAQRMSPLGWIWVDGAVGERVRDL